MSTTNALDPARDPFLPQPLAGRGFGVALTLLAHGLLLLGLTLAVNWRVSTPATVEAELWAAVPRAAPAADVQPPPPPPVEPPKPEVKPPEPRVEPKPSRAEQDAQIATEKAKREKERNEAENKRKEEEKKLAEKKAEQERREKAEKEAKQKEKEAQLAREEARRQQHLARILNDANQQSSSGTPTSGSPGADYTGQLQKYIRDKVSFPPNAPDGSSAEVRIFLTPGGRVLNQRIIRSSGNPVHDDAILRDIQKAEKMPTPRDGPAPSSIDVTVSK
jgi:colicin import membrane protein